MPANPFQRWWVYQRERFPVVAHGALIAAFSSSALAFSALLRGQTAPPGVVPFLVAFGTCFLFFLQLRIADEFKDFEEDLRYRPYRPVQRGLVSLRELGVLGVAAAAVQLGLALWLYPSLALVLAVVWAYLALMSKEFFVGDWLKRRPILYMVSHMAIVPQVDFYATACDWMPLGGRPPAGLPWFLAVSYFNGLVIEMGRKIRGPKEEEEGVATYSALWGRRNAVLAWYGAMLVTAALAVAAAWQVGWAVPLAVVLGVLLLLAAAVAGLFLRRPDGPGGKRIEAASGVWTLLLYLNLGVVPLLWRWCAAARGG
jgi:4-hydroxybenzoate polyprenyltransferase